MSQELDMMFNGTGSANASSGGNYFRDGKYVARLANLTAKTANGLCFIAEVVVETAEATEPPEVQPNGPNAVGSLVGTVIKFEGDAQKKQMAQSKMKSIGLAVMQLTEEEFNAQQAAENERARLAGQPARDIMAAFLKRSIQSDQKFRGVAIAVNTYRKPTKAQKAQGEGGEAFRSKWNCYPLFSAIKGQTPETIAAGRTWVESKLGTPSAPPAEAPAPSAPPPVPAPAPLPEVPALPSSSAPAPTAPAPTGSILDML